MIKKDITSTGEILSSDELKIGYWYVTHKLLLRRILIIGLAVFDLFLISYSLYGVLDYFLISLPERQALDRQMTEPKMNYAYLNELSAPQSLSVNFTDSLKSSKEKVDFIAEVANYNESWYALPVVYHFESGDYKTSSVTDYLLPGQTKYLMVLGQPSGAGLIQPNLIIESINWKKVINYNNLKEKFWDFQVTDQKFEAPQETGLSNGVAISRVSFTTENKSAYNYWNVKLKVLLMRAETIVAVNEVRLDYLNSGDKIKSEFLLYDLPSLSNKIIVYPEVDILNPESFKGFDGVGEPK